MGPLIPPPDFAFTAGDSIHTSLDPHPHLSGSIGGVSCHLPLVGQTTLPMFDQGLRDSGGIHRLDDVNRIAERFPDTFRGLDFGPPKY